MVEPKSRLRQNRVTRHELSLSRALNWQRSRSSHELQLLRCLGIIQSRDGNCFVVPTQFDSGRPSGGNLQCRRELALAHRTILYKHSRQCPIEVGVEQRGGSVFTLKKKTAGFIHERRVDAVDVELIVSLQ